MSHPSGPPLPQAQPRSSRGPVVLAALVGLVVLAIVVASLAGWRPLSGDSSPASPNPRITPTASPSVPMPTTDPALGRFYAQKLHWRDCGSNRCAWLTVPLDYTKPTGSTIKIAVLKVPAADPGRRVGALVVNPGGPGGSGVGFAAAGAAQFGETLASYFDIVGFDPRGVGSSNPLRCQTTAQLDALLASDPDPDTAAERAASDQLLNRFGQGCLDRSGDLARHVSTREAARDMDVLRAALGQPKLDYLGSSYGTFLGATYAEEFPGHVGRFVLDGAVDPALSNAQLSLQQAHGFETALRSYVADCVGRDGCVLGSSVEQGVRRVRGLLAELDQRPMATGTDRPLTEGLATLGIWLPLYDKDAWVVLTQALRAAIEDGDGSALLSLADQYASRGPHGYTDNSMEALYAVNCLDHDDYIPTAEVPAHFAEFEKASPTFGRTFAFSLSACASWPVRSGQHTVALHAPGAPPIVVIGTTRDPATPLAWAQALSRELSSGRLITRDGDGHTGFRHGSSCVDDAVETWLVSGRAPRPDLHC